MCVFGSIGNWLWNIPDRALERAYVASKRVRKIQRDYISYKGQNSRKRSWRVISLYMDSTLNHYLFEIRWSLSEFKVTKSFLENIAIILSGFTAKNVFESTKNQSKIDLNKSIGNYKPVKENSETGFDSDYKRIVVSSSKQNKSSDPKPKPKHILSYLQFDSIAEKLHNFSVFFQSKRPTYLKSEDSSRKFAWIEATLIDLEVLRQQYAEPSNVLEEDVAKSNPVVPLSSLSFTPKTIAYESVGLVPRSITRTLSRFQSELAGRSASLVLPEFRLAKYQAVASLQYMACLIILPWVLSSFLKTVVFKPLVENWWDTYQSQIFINGSQEQKALKKLQNIEELLWLDIVISDNSQQYPQDLSAQIHQKTIQLVDVYNRQSVDTILHLFTDFISLTGVGLVLTWGKKRLAIFSSWVQELFYSLSDTMKAFFILLFTDLCIGFHSPHGWEILIDLLLEHLGFSHNKHVISCFVSTFPVILDTVFKYWIFRHLNRISPSIVVTYHTMNE